jgi:uncharacterized protein (DUF885 family)
MSPAFARLSCLIGCALLLAACSRPHPAQSSAAAAKSAALPASSAAAARVNAIAEKYWDDDLALHPLTATALGDRRYDDRFGDYASPNWMADGLAIEQETLESLKGIDVKKLSADERVTYESLRAGREIAAEGFRYPSELLAVDPVSNLPVRFAVLGTGQETQAFRTTADYDRFLARMDGFVAWVDQAINDLRSGVAKGVVYPKSVVERTLPPLAEIGVADPQQSLFWQPLLTLPAGMTVADRRRLLDAYREKLGKQVLPAYRRLHAYLQNEYLPAARTRPGMNALPSGDVWYAYLVRYYSGTQLTPDAVHEAGLHEVARIRADAERLMHQSSPAADLRSYFEALRADPASRPATAADLLAAYAATQERVRPALPLLFASLPQIPLAIRATEPIRARYADPANYRPPAVDGKSPGVLYVNTSALETRPRCMVETQYLHEALPGRHLQAGLALEGVRWPRIRRIGDDVAYREGWALYAQSLGRDLGLYADAASYACYLMTDLWMAAQVVIDTGLHAKGWTREQAVQYLRTNSGLTEADIEADVDRSLAQPGMLIAPKMGELKIRELRQRAQQQLGARFDIRGFHGEVAGGGSMPLPVLEQKVDAWIALQQ